MGHWSEPQVVIPHYDVPAGTLFYIQNRHGLTTYQKQSDGGWEAVALDKTRGTNSHKTLDKPLTEGLG